MRHWIGRIIAWFLREYTLVDGNTIAISADEYVQIQKASFDRRAGYWNVNVRVFTKDGTILGTVQVADLAKIHIREAAARKT